MVLDLLASGERPVGKTQQERNDSSSKKQPAKSGNHSL